MPSLRLLPGERVSLRPGALWFETGPLKQEWRPNTHLSARLILDRFEIPVEIHIESPTELSGRRTPQAWGRDSSKC